MLTNLELDPILSSKISKIKLQKEIKTFQEKIFLKKASALYIDNLFNQKEDSIKNEDFIDQDESKKRANSDNKEYNKIYKIYKNEIKHMAIDQEEINDETNKIPNESSEILQQSIYTF